MSKVGIACPYRATFPVSDGVARQHATMNFLSALWLAAIGDVDGSWRYMRVALAWAAPCA